MCTRPSSENQSFLVNQVMENVAFFEKLKELKSVYVEVWDPKEHNKDISNRNQIHAENWVSGLCELIPILITLPQLQVARFKIYECRTEEFATAGIDIFDTLETRLDPPPMLDDEDGWFDEENGCRGEEDPQPMPDQPRIFDWGQNRSLRKLENSSVIWKQTLKVWRINQ